MEKLAKKHEEHIAVYGEHNVLRLTGKHETAPITEFRVGKTM
jgi:glutamine synthetase